MTYILGNGYAYNDDDLNSILKYCAYLRGTMCTIHRTLREFEVFVDTIIFESGPTSMEYAYLLENDASPDSLITYARGFAVYCEQKYSNEKAEE